MVDAAIIGGLLTNLVPVIRDGFSLFSSFEKDVEKLSDTLSLLNAVLEDADTKIKLEKMDKQTEDWLRKLKVVAYEVRDIMDDCKFEDLRLQVKMLNASSSTLVQVTNCIAHPFRTCTWTRLKIGHKIKDVLEKLNQFSSERTMFQLSETTRDSTQTSSRQTISKLSENVYGRDKEKEKIVNILVHTSHDALYVLPILGLGGLGKTTLAQIVFNDEEITKCFDVKFWVCVSEVFDILSVIKAIIGATNESCLERLQNKVQDKLRGKKYLIVLDDVWNENIDEWNRLRSVLDCGSNGPFILTTTRKRNVAEIMKTRGVQLFELSSLSFDDCWQLFEERAFIYGTQKPTNFIDIGKEIAKKCKGVPLVAKTLGSQLAFKSDENYWCTIRDSEMWKISENEESILPILKLSYYDLPYLLRRCFSFCAIFPKDTEIEKERLIQLWIAHDLIPMNKNQEGENNENTIWDELCWRSFFQDEKEQISRWKEVQKTCKMHDLMHDLAQSIMKDECYMMDVKSSNFGREIRHITVMIDEFTKTSIDSLKKIRGLQSIILYPPFETFSKEILSVLKELPSLRVIESVSQYIDIQRQDFYYVGCLKYLRYLDISDSLVIKLPNSICGLLNLQTLKLNGCLKLKSLPRNMKDLINLQHLYLNACISLRYMPGGMRQLKGLKTLSLVVVGKKNRDCQLDEFKDLEIKGSLEIRNLERVSDGSIARGVSMTKMSSINKLELQWEDNDQTRTRHEKIGEALEVSSTCLKILIMRGYKGVNIPKLVGMSSATLEELEIWNMKNLRELMSPPIHIPITTIEAFSNLRKIDIYYCPMVGALPPHLSSLKVVRVKGECTDELLYSISDLSALIDLTVSELRERSVLFKFGGGNYYKADRNENEKEKTSSSSSTLAADNNINESTLAADNNINEAQGGPASSTFQSLQRLEIFNCKKLSCLFDEEGCEKLARGGGGCLTNLSSLTISNCPELMISLEQWRFLGTHSLQYLTIWNCPELMISLEQWRNLGTHSLQHLYISECPKLVPSKVEEADEVLELLRSLRERLGPNNFNVDILNKKDQSV